MKPRSLSHICGARDLLVRSGVNSHVFETDNSAGLAHFLRLLGDEPEWRRLSANSHGFRYLADTDHFVAAVREPIARLEGRGLTAASVSAPASPHPVTSIPYSRK